MLNKKEIIKFLIISMVIVSACIGSRDYVREVFNDISERKEERPENTFDDKGNKEVALTFEIDGDDKGLDILLSILKDKGAHATFFALGSWANNNKEKVLSIINDGHEIGNHTMTHQNVKDISMTTFSDEIKACHDVIKNINGYEMSLFKFTFNNYDNVSINEVRKNGYIPVEASVITNDNLDISKEEILNNIKQSENLKSGSIIEFNLASKNTLYSISDVISYLDNEGYKCVSLSKDKFSSNKSKGHKEKKDSSNNNDVEENDNSINN